jgi:protein O-mannosyl-transferase
MRSRFFPILLLICMMIAVFYQVYSFDFVRFDDYGFIVENPHVTTGLNSENFIWAFQFGTTENWHPLTWLSLQLDAELFGPSAKAFHLSNLSFHVLNTILLFLWLYQISGSTFKSFLVAALFGIHPLHVESVAWVSERKDTLSTLFGILTLICYTKYAQTETKKWFYYSLVAYSTSLLCKQMLVTMPFLLILLDHWPYKRFQFSQNVSEEKNKKTSRKKQANISGSVTQDSSISIKTFRQIALEKIPFLILTILFSATTFIAQSSGGAVRSFEKFTIFARVLNAISVYALYLVKMLWPFHLSFFYPHPQDNYQVDYILVGLIVIIAVSLYAWFRRNQLPYIFTGWFWYLGTLVPVIGIIQIGQQQMADRYTYFPIIGIFIAIVWFGNHITQGNKTVQKIMGGLSLLVVGIFGFVAHQQVGYWENSYTLFQRALDVNEDNVVAHNNLAAEYLAVNEVGKAKQHYQKAIEVAPTNSTALSNLSVIYAQQGNRQKAIEYVNLALHYEPHSAIAHNNLANILRMAGSFDDAIYHYQEALNTKPNYPEALSNYASLLTSKGDLAKSEELLRKAILIKPKYGKAHKNLGDTLMKLNRLDEAVEHYKKAVVLNPTNLQFKFNLSAAYEKLSQYDQALAILKECEKFELKNKIIPYKLLNIYIQLEDWVAANQILEKLTKKEGLTPAVQVLKARLATKQKKFDEAIDILNQLIKKKSTSFELYNELGEILLEKGDKKEAISAFEKAIQLNPEYEKAKNNLKSIK